MAITTMDLIVAALANQQMQPFNKSSITTVAGAYFTLLNAPGQPGAGTLSIGNTTTGVVPTSSLAGALPFTNPVSGMSYLLLAEGGSSSLGSLIFYDRLQHSGSYSFANGNINTTSMLAVTRDTTGAGVEAWVEINTGLSALACTLTLTYTNQAGTSGQTATCVVPASAISARMFPFVLAAGDTGIRSIQNLAGSAAPTGSFNVVLLRRLHAQSIAVASVAMPADYALTGMPRIYDDACICMLLQANSTTSGTLNGHIVIGQG